MNEKKNIFFGSIVSYITIFVEVIISIIYTPFLLKSLGDIDYGIRAFCVSLVSYLNLLTLGFGDAYYRFRKLKQNEGEENSKKINGLFILIFSLIAIISLIVGFAFILLLKNSIISFDKFPPERNAVIIIVLSIMVVQTALHFPFSTLTLILGYRRKFAIRNTINLINVILVPVTTTLLIVFKIYNILLISVTLVSFFVSLFIDLSKAFVVFFKEKEKISFKLNMADYKLILPIFSYCLITFAASAVSIVHNATDQVILGTIISAEAVTLYALSVTFSNYLTTMTTSISSLFSPKLTNDAIDKKHESVKYTCDFVWTAIAIILAFIIGGFLTCGNEFIKGWLGPEKSTVFYFASLLMAVNAITSGIKISYTVQTALNKHKFAAIVYIIFLVVNIILSITLAIPMGVYGVIVGTLASKILETIILSLYSKKIIKLPLLKYWVSLIKNGLIAIMAIAMVKGIFNLIDIAEMSYYLQAAIKGLVFCLFFLPASYFVNRKFVRLFVKTLKKN